MLTVVLSLSLIVPAPPLPLVLADVALTERVLDNLIDNALRYAGHARVSLAVAADQILVTVEQAHEPPPSGAGLPAKTRASVLSGSRTSSRASRRPWWRVAKPWP